MERVGRGLVVVGVGLLFLGSLQELEQSNLLSTETQEQRCCGDGRHSGSGSVGEDQTTDSGEGGRGPCFQEERLTQGHGDQADGESDGE